MAQIKARRDELGKEGTMASFDEQCNAADAYAQLCKEQRSINNDVLKKQEDLKKQEALATALLESHKQTIQDLRGRLEDAHDQIQNLELEKDIDMRAKARHKRQKTAHMGHA